MNTEFKTCKRCKKYIESHIMFMIDGRQVLAPRNYCDGCQIRNFLDKVNAPTPPALIDTETVNPTLSNEQFERQGGEKYLKLALDLMNHMRRHVTSKPE